MLAENVRFEDFCDTVRELFGAEVRTQDIKHVFQKISTNPDAKYDWFEVHFMPQYTVHTQADPRF